MNYSTLKKTVALSLATAFAVAANAQDSSTTMANTSSAKVFGGRAQYRTWTFGINGGFTTPNVLTGGQNDFGRNVDFGEHTLGVYYGIALRKQLSHSFGLQGNLNRGDVIGYNKQSGTGLFGGTGIYSTHKTQVQYDVNLSGVINLATLNFLNRENAVKLYATAGYGLIAFDPVIYSTYANGDGTPAFVNKGKYGADGDHDYIRQAYIPVGLGLKFKLSDRVALDLGYDMKFIDGDNFDGVYAGGGNDKFSYTHAGLEFSLGSKAKPDLNWANPVAMMYDELKDPTLRQEVEALKGRVSNVEQSVEDLKKDTDGDGVADHLDKCPNSPAGAKVDGGGCEIDTDGDGVPDWKDDCPTEKGTAELNGCPEMGTGTMTGVDNIQFEYNSSVLRTSAYPTLDRMSSTLRGDKALSLQLDGHASEEGTDAYNMQLSIDRANAVKTYLVNSGVDAKRISTKGYGESRPIASNATEEGRMRNRRVEFRQK